MDNFRFFLFFRYINWSILKKTFQRSLESRLLGLASEIAFNAMLALFPAILAIFTAIGLFEESLQFILSDLVRQYKDVVPIVVWDLLKSFVEEITRTKSKGLFSVSFIVAIWLSSGALSTAMNALDQIAHIPTDKKRKFWQAKLISLVITLGSIFLLVVASFLVFLGDYFVKLVINLMVRFEFTEAGISLLALIWRLLSWPIVLGVLVITIASIYEVIKSPQDSKHPIKKLKLILIIMVISGVFLFLLTGLLVLVNNLMLGLKFDYSIGLLLVNISSWLSWPVALLFVSIAFAFIYRIGVSSWQKGTPILPGALLAAISWAIVSGLFRLYVTNFGQYNRVYGAVGAVIVLMLWLQITSLILLLGYQLNTIVGEEIIKNNSKSIFSNENL
jgi:membrane protein